MKSREDKNVIVDGGMRDAWVGAGLEVPAASFDPGNAMRRALSPDQSKKAAAQAKRDRRAKRNRDARVREIAAGMMQMHGCVFGIDHSAGPDETKYFVREGSKIREISDAEYERLAGVQAER